MEHLNQYLFDMSAEYPLMCRESRLRKIPKKVQNLVCTSVSRFGSRAAKWRDHAIRDWTRLRPKTAEHVEADTAGGPLVPWRQPPPVAPLFAVSFALAQGENGRHSDSRINGLQEVHGSIFLTATAAGVTAATITSGAKYRTKWKTFMPCRYFCRETLAEKGLGQSE